MLQRNTFNGWVVDCLEKLQLQSQCTDDHDQSLRISHEHTSHAKEAARKVSIWHVRWCLDSMQAPAGSMPLLQVEEYLDRGTASKTGVSEITAARQLQKELQQLANRCSDGSPALDFIQQCKGAPYGLRNCQGRPGISRKVVRMVFVDFAEAVLPDAKRLQQEGIRSQAGSFIASDGTYKIMSSLCGAQAMAPNASNKSKQASYFALCVTATAEGGFVLAAVVAPDDSHKTPQALLCGLQHAQLPQELADLSTPYFDMIREQAMVGGPLARWPCLLRVDNAGQCVNMWKNICSEVREAWKQRGALLFSPLGVSLPHMNSLLSYVDA